MLFLPRVKCLFPALRQATSSPTEPCLSADVSLRSLLEDGDSVRIPCRGVVPAAWRGDSRIEVIEIADLTKTNLTATFILLSSLAAAVTANATHKVIADVTDPSPSTPYGAAKRAAEGHVRKLADVGCFAVSLRLPLVVGSDAKVNWHSLQKIAATGVPLPLGSVISRRNFINVQSLSEAIAILVGRSWPASLSGDYCIADPEALSLSEVLTELRQGMGLGPRLLPCPPRLFDLLGAVTGRQRQPAGLTGSLRVDGSRFVETFSSIPSLFVRTAICRSGVAFKRRRPSAELGADISGAPASQMHSGRSAAAERLIDVPLALGASLVAAPFVLVAIATIRLTSPGAAVFRQVRVGLHEQPFVCLKLRTMRSGTVSAPSHEVPGSFVKPIGRFLRRTKIDELPQLWNILRSEMSFVGPRPWLPSQTALIEERRRYGLYALRPGITGVAQVAGVDVSAPQRLAAVEANYLSDQSLRTDLKLIAATLLGAGRGGRTRDSRPL